MNTTNIHINNVQTTIDYNRYLHFHLHRENLVHIKYCSNIVFYPKIFENAVHLRYLHLGFAILKKWMPLVLLDHYFPKHRRVYPGNNYFQPIKNNKKVSVPREKDLLKK